jgi:hypothetical protein
VSHLFLSELNGPLFVGIGLAVWALAYVFLTRVITPGCIGDLMALIAAFLPPASGVIAIVVAVSSFTSNPRHIARGITFVAIFATAALVTFIQLQNSEVRQAMNRAAKRPKSFQSTIRLISWGLAGAILVFVSELSLVFGGWQLIQGSWAWGCASAGIGALIVIVNFLGSSSVGIFKWNPHPNPISKAILALKGDDEDHSIKFIKRLLAPARGETRASSRL